MTKQQQLKKLNTHMQALCVCTLKKIATQAVSGAGSAKAEILFIGEAPGKKEDQEGVPFVGAAGKMLSQLLASINLARTDIYITNIVKYRPPENRDPTQQEVDDCWEWLSEQIRLIDPLLIVPLGRHALERFVPGRKISEDHGRIFTKEIEGLGVRTFYALYHPAAALYNGSLRATLFTDFKKIPQLLKQEKKKR